MIAITTSNSISVNPDRRRVSRMGVSRWWDVEPRAFSTKTRVLQMKMVGRAYVELTRRSVRKRHGGGRNRPRVGGSTRTGLRQSGAGALHDAGVGRVGTLHPEQARRQ